MGKALSNVLAGQLLMFGLPRKAGQAFLDGMKAHFPDSWQAILGSHAQAKQPCEKLVRLSRTRLDGLMLLRRESNTLLLGQAQVFRAIRFDSSPQRGVEMFAPREDVWNGHELVDVDRHLPFAVLGCGFLSALDKGMTFLWQVF